MLFVRGPETRCFEAAGFVAGRYPDRGERIRYGPVGRAVRRRGPRRCHEDLHGQDGVPGRIADEASTTVEAVRHGDTARQRACAEEKKAGTGQSDAAKAGSHRHPPSIPALAGSSVGDPEASAPLIITGRWRELDRGWGRPQVNDPAAPHRRNRAGRNRGSPERRYAGGSPRRPRTTPQRSRPPRRAPRRCRAGSTARAAGACCRWPSRLAPEVAASIVVAQFGAEANRTPWQWSSMADVVSGRAYSDPFERRRDFRNAVTVAGEAGGTVPRRRARCQTPQGRRPTGLPRRSRSTSSRNRPRSPSLRARPPAHWRR